MDFKNLSPNSFIIYFGNEISTKTSKKVIATYKAIINEKIDDIIDIIPSYTSIVIIFDFFKTDFEDLKLLIENLDISFTQNSSSEIINIDVYYGLEIAIDLKNLANSKSLTIEEVIDIHSNKVYDIFAIGFLPGFAYLGNVDEKIAMPRLTTPRKNISKGSVAIADTQTAIYPQNSPGGWNIIGQTTFNCFDKNLESLSLFKVGAKVKFNPVSKNEFLKQGGKI